MASALWNPLRRRGRNPPGVLRAHDVLAKLDVDTFVDGHVTASARPRTSATRATSPTTCGTPPTASSARSSSPTTPPQVEPGNNWASFQLYYDAIADKVEPEIIQRWVDNLGGVDVFTCDNVITIAISLLLDAPKDVC
jgi:hypothetical protein